MCSSIDASSTTTRRDPTEVLARRTPAESYAARDRSNPRGPRIGFGRRNFENYRIRALLYAGKPNWRVLGSIVVR
jgi:hypothetical protein